MTKKRTSIPDIKNLIEDACKSPPKRKRKDTTPKLSRDLTIYFRRISDGGLGELTLGELYGIYQKLLVKDLLNICRYNPKDYPLDLSSRLYQEIGLELRKLIRVYGKKKTILSLL